MEKSCCKQPCGKDAPCDKPCGPCKMPCDKPCKKPCDKPCKKPCEKPCEMEKKAKKIVESAIMFMVPEWDCFYKEILQAAILMAMKKYFGKGKSGDCCGKKGECKCGPSCKCEKPGDCGDKKCCGKKGECKCGPSCKCEKPGDCGDKKCCGSSVECDKECSPEMCGKMMCKKFIGHCKDTIKERIDACLAIFKKLFGDLPPMFGKHKQCFIKTICKILMKMHECSECCQGKCTKECLEKIATDGWIKKKEKLKKCMMKKAKKFAKDAVLFVCDCDCPQVCKDAAAHFLAKLTAKRWHMCMAKKEKCTKEGKCPEMKGCPKEMKKCMKQECATWAAAFLKENCECFKNCTMTAKEALEVAFKDHPCIPEKCKNKVIIKIVNKCKEMVCCEKVCKEGCKEFAAKYIKNVLTCCKKDCNERCQKVFKLAMKLNGVKDPFVLSIGSVWGAHMCCKANGKVGCPEDVVAEFAAKWIKDFLPTVAEAVKTTQELMDACKECCGTYYKEKCAVKALMWYLKFNCAEAKFNKDEFKKYWAELVEKMKKCSEKCCGTTCCDKKPEEKK